MAASVEKKLSTTMESSNVKDADEELVIGESSSDIVRLKALYSSHEFGTSFPLPFEALF
jgi:hypothetical protein